MLVTKGSVYSTYAFIITIIFFKELAKLLQQQEDDVSTYGVFLNS
jgi:hypothetical protein